MTMSEGPESLVDAIEAIVPWTFESQRDMCRAAAAAVLRALPAAGYILADRDDGEATFTDPRFVADLVEGRTRWEMFGWRDEERGHWVALGARRFVQFHGCADPIPVTVTEDAEGTHLGWIATEEPAPRMILRREIFEIQFPYGSKAEVEAGRGRVVRLSIRTSPTPRRSP